MCVCLRCEGNTSQLHETEASGDTVVSQSVTSEFLLLRTLLGTLSVGHRLCRGPDRAVAALWSPLRPGARLPMANKRQDQPCVTSRRPFLERTHGSGTEEEEEEEEREEPRLRPVPALQQTQGSTFQ